MEQSRKNGMKHLFIKIIALICFASIAYSKNIEIMYTPISTEFCKTMSIYTDESYADYAFSQCPSPKNWRVYVEFSSNNSWLLFETNDLLWSTNEIPRFGDSGIENITDEKIEWHLKDNKVVGLIFRKKAFNPEGTNKSKLFVAKIYNKEMKFCGWADTNQEAREILQSHQCNTLIKKIMLQSVVIINKSVLYEFPSGEYATKAYLVTGDKATLLGEQTDSQDIKWYHILYHGKRNIYAWIKADTVTVVNTNN